MVGNIGKRRLRVGKVQPVEGRDEEVIRVGKDEVAHIGRPIGKKPRESGRPHVAQGVVLTENALGEVDVLKVMREGINLYRVDTAEAAVGFPYAQAGRYVVLLLVALLVRAEDVGRTHLVVVRV